MVDLAGHAGEHPDDHDHGEDKDDLLAQRQLAQRQQGDAGAEDEAAAEDAPIGRPPLAGLEPHQQRTRYGDQRHDQAEQEHGLVGEPLRQQARHPGDREDAERQRQSAEHLHHAEVVVDFGLGTRSAVGVGARHHFRAHGVGHHVLQHQARHGQERGDDVEPAGGQHRDPPSRGAGQQDEGDRDHAGADEYVDAPLRAQERHGVDQLAEHHLRGPRQGEPGRQGGQLGRRPGEALLDPEGLGDGGEPHGAVGEIDHQQRQILATHGAHRRQQCALDLPSPIVGRPWACGIHRSKHPALRRFANMPGR